MTKRLDVSRDDAGVRLRTARLRRGMSQVALAEMACVSSSFVSMVETGERHLRRASDILALADVLRVSPRYLADGWDDPAARGSRALETVPFPARCDPITLARHQQLARHFIDLARQDARATGDWLRRLAREPAVNPWLLIDQLGMLLPRPVTPGNEPPMTRSPDRWFAVIDGTRLWQLRRQRGLSTAELAGKAGIGLSTVTRLQSQPRCSCRTRTLVRLAAALGQPAAVLAQDAAGPGSPVGVEHLARFGADFADLADPDVMSAAWT